MSRIGKQPIKVPSWVKVSVEGNTYKFEGPKGKLARTVPDGVKIDQEGDTITVTPDESVENSRAYWGLVRTLLNNCVQGVNEGFSKTLEINGVGYRAQAQGQVLNLTLGFSHPVAFQLPEGISAKVEKNTVVTISGADKEAVGQVSAEIRGLRPVEPYQGKGIRYQGEYVIRKAGKAAGGKSA